MTVTCEVCETVQPPASVCASCGLALKVPAGVPLVGDPVIEPLPGFEATRQDEVGELFAPMIPDLEFTRTEPIGEVGTAVLDGFEPTQDLDLDFGFDDAGPPVPGLEPTGDTFEKTTTADALQPLDCPYCGFRQAEGRICNNCGRARTRVLRTTGALRGNEELVRCRACGARVLPEALCSDCGQPLPPPED